VLAVIIMELNCLEDAPLRLFLTPEVAVAFPVFLIDGPSVVYVGHSEPSRFFECPYSAFFSRTKFGEDPLSFSLGACRLIIPVPLILC